MNFSWLFLFNFWDNALAVVSLLLAVYLIACLLKPINLLETVLFSFCIAPALIAIWGYVLSPFNKLADLSAWAALGVVTALVAAFVFFLLKPGFIPLQTQIRASVKAIVQWYLQITAYEKAVLIPLIIAASALAVFNLIMTLFTLPASWDSLTYHLPRMAYYIQQGNFSMFGANYWAQAVHPKNSTALLIYLFLVAGRSESLMQLMQFASHLIFAAGIYGISIKIGASRAQSIFSALISSLLTAGIMQLASAQNDLSIAVYFGAVTYALLAFRKNPRGAYLLVSGLGIASALGAKSSALAALPSIALIAAYALAYRVDSKTALKNILRLAVFTLAFMLPLVLPSGYVENIQRFGSPIGPLDVRQMHSFEGQNAEYILKGGAYNALRFGFDFLSFDGLPQTDYVNAAQNALRFIPNQILAFFEIDLESDFAAGFSPFDLDVDRANSWGVLGFGLIWVAVALALFRTNKNRDAFILALAAILFFLAQAFAGPYDAARGRYFLICALFAAPVSGVWLAARSKIIRIYVAVILLIGVISATSIAAKNAPLFFKNRNEQFLFFYPNEYAKIKAFDFLVSQDAVVAVYLYPNTFEYPLFGKHLTRTLLPINSFYEGLQPIPEAAQYLLYVKGYPCPNEKDRHLKGDWFLRKLDANNRECEFSRAGH